MYFKYGNTAVCRVLSNTVRYVVFTHPELTSFIFFNKNLYFKNILEVFYIIFVILFLLFFKSAGQRLPSVGQALGWQQTPGLSNQKALCDGTGNKNRGTLRRNRQWSWLRMVLHARSEIEEAEGEVNESQEETDGGRVLQRQNWEKHYGMFGWVQERWTFSV